MSTPRFLFWVWLVLMCYDYHYLVTLFIMFIFFESEYFNYIMIITNHHHHHHHHHCPSSLSITHHPSSIIHHSSSIIHHHSSFIIHHHSSFIIHHHPCHPHHPPPPPHHHHHVVSVRFFLFFFIIVYLKLCIIIIIILLIFWLSIHYSFTTHESLINLSFHVHFMVFFIINHHGRKTKLYHSSFTLNLVESNFLLGHVFPGWNVNHMLFSIGEVQPASTWCYQLSNLKKMGC